MNLSLTPELKQLIQRKIDSGLYANASEVVRDALRKLDAGDPWQPLREILLPRIAAAEREAARGELIPLEEAFARVKSGKPRHTPSQEH